MRAPILLPLPPLLLLLGLGLRVAADEGPAEELEEEDGVLVLRAASFDRALAAHPHLLVEFCECRAGGAGRAGPGRGRGAAGPGTDRAPPQTRPGAGTARRWRPSTSRPRRS